MVRRIAVPVNRSFDGSLSRLTPLVRAPAQDGRGGYPGAFPARIWTSLGGNARTRRMSPAKSVIAFHPSRTSRPTS